MNTEVWHMALLQNTGNTGTNASCRNTTAVRTSMLAHAERDRAPVLQAGMFEQYTSLSIRSREAPETPILASDGHTPSQYESAGWNGELVPPIIPP
ncbi:MAG: hypothetical protein RQ758_05480 [Methanomicrobiaceae archaeon]|nr:hypothetical protein [Methanomicrobiaceae archaeon]